MIENIKVAVFSDIHSNVWALEAVLSDAQQRQATHLVNLGDILYGPLAPRETYDLLQKNEITTIRGNQDRQIYQATEADIAANPTLQFILKELGDEPLEWMQELPACLSVDPSIFLCHGTPNSDLVYMLEDVSTGEARVKSEKAIQAYLTNIAEGLVLCGHSHLPRTVSLQGGQLVVNPGSVGLPAYKDEEPVNHKIENYSPLASYAIVERISGGWKVEHIKVTYAVQSAVNAALKRGRSDWAKALETGRIIDGVSESEAGKKGLT